MRMKHFMMSMRFNKTAPQDFGLLPTEKADVFILPSDGSLWISRSLYDFGWGPENGYCRLPMPGFEGLIDIALNSEYEEDRYGAAAVLLEDHSEAILERCLEIFDGGKTEEYLGLFKLLQLDSPMNRSVTIRKSCDEIQCDYTKWKDISREITRIEKRIARGRHWETIEKHKRCIGVVAYYLLGLLFPPIASRIYAHFREISATYYQFYGLAVAVMGIFIGIGVYIALYGIVVKEKEKLWASALSCSVSLFLTVFTNLAASIPWIYRMDKFHIWTILFGFFLIRSLAGLSKYRKARRAQGEVT